MRYRLLFIMAVLFYPGLNSLSAQTALFGKVFDTATTAPPVTIAGTLNHHILVVSQPFNETPVMTVLDSNGNPKHVVSLESIAFPSSRPIAFFPSGNSLLAFSQKKTGNSIYLSAVRINEQGVVPGSYQLLDSSRTEYLQELAYFNHSYSKVSGSILLYRMLPNRVAGKLVVDFIRLDKNALITDKGTMLLPFTAATQEVSSVYEHSSGEPFFAIYNKPDNFHLLSNMMVYRFTSTPKNEFLRKISFKATTPGPPVFATNSAPDRLTMACTYAEQYSVDWDGVQVVTVGLKKNDDTQQAQFFPFLKKSLNGAHSGSRRINLDNRALEYRNIKLLNCYYLSGSDDIHVLLETHYQLAPSQYTSNNEGGSYPGDQTAPASNLTPSQNLEVLRAHVRSLDNLTTPSNITRYGGQPYIAPASTLSGGGAFANWISDAYSLPNANSINTLLNNDHVAFEKPSRLEHIELTIPPTLDKVDQEKLSMKIEGGENGQLTARMILDQSVLLFNFNTKGTSPLIFQAFGLKKPKFQKELVAKKGVIPFFNNAVCQFSDHTLHCLYYSPQEGVGVVRMEW